MNKNTANGFEVRPYRAGDEEELLARGLRESDRQELWKLTGLQPEQAIAEYLPAMHNAGCVGTMLFEGKVFCLFGVYSFEGDGKGAPWLIAHSDFERSELAIPIARVCRKFIKHWLRHFGVLENICDAESVKGIEFLLWLGFSFDTELPVRGPLGHDLIRFWRAA